MIRIADPKPTPDQLFAYTGREHDGGLYFYRHRHFDPTVGRWLDREPVGYADADGQQLAPKNWVVKGVQEGEGGRLRLLAPPAR